MDSQHDGFEAGGVYVAEADDRIEELTLPGWLEHVTHVVVEGVGGDYDNVGWVVGFIEGGWMELREGAAEVVVTPSRVSIRYLA